MKKAKHSPPPKGPPCRTVRDERSILPVAVALLAVAWAVALAVT